MNNKTNEDIEYIIIEFRNKKYSIEIIQDDEDNDGKPVYGFGTYEYKSIDVKEKIKTVSILDKEFAISTDKKKVILYAIRLLFIYIELNKD